MPLVSVGVTLGTPSQVGEVPITVSNLAAQIAQAVVDTSALAVGISTVQADITTVDTDIATVQADITNTTTDANTANTRVGTCGTDFDAVASNVPSGLATLFAGTAYNSSTKQITGTPSGSVTLTVAQQQAVIALVNALGADLVTAKTNTQQVISDLTTAAADASTAKNASATTKTFANTLATTAVAADHTAAQAIIASANVYLQTDSGVVANVAALNGALVAALTFVRDTNILPT